MSAISSGTFNIARSGTLRTAIDRLLDGTTDAGLGPLGRRLAEGFFRRSDDVYLLQRRLDTILAQWHDLYRWVQIRAPRAIKVRVLNATEEANGYAIPRTVIQTCMDDQPFIFDTLVNLLATIGLKNPRCIHPILGVVRDEDGRITKINPLPQATEGNESMMHFEIPWVESAERRGEIERTVVARLRKVQAMVADFRPMADRARYFAGHLGEHLEGGADANYLHVTVVQRFFHWLLDENFVFMGYVEYEVQGDKAVAHADGLLGLNRLEHTPDGLGTPFPRDLSAWLRGDGLVHQGKGHEEAGIHRSGRIDQIALRFFHDKAERVGLFTGLYTQKAIAEEVGRIPILREKLDLVLRAHAALEGSHLHRRLLQSFRAIPVEFLFSAEVAAIEGAVRLIMAAEESQETGVHMLVDGANRSAFVIVSLPRESYDDDVRVAASERLMESTGANYMDYRLAFGPSGNVVLQFYLSAAERFTFEDAETVERDVAAVTQTWSELVAKLLRPTLDEEEGQQVLERYLDSLPDEYRHQSDPAETVEDLRALERARVTGALQVTVGTRADDALAGVTRLKIYQRKKIYLTDSTPVLDHFGLRVIDQSSIALTSGDGESFYIDSFRVVPADGSVTLSDHHERLLEALCAVLCDEAEDDSLNSLLLTAGLGWREVDVLRAYINYGRQLGTPAPMSVVHRTWRAHPVAARQLLALFRARFNPALGSPTDATRVKLVSQNRQGFIEYLAGVQTSAEDRLLRGPLNLLDATLRTNFFGRTHREDTPFAFKIDCSLVESMVEPRPYREIFVFNDKVEGIHLRGGPVARGGLRWSDRPEDYRTEVLGLMDTQMVKNVLIVPVGAKGGFILKQSYETRGEARDAADRYYKTFIRGLLSLTDNVVDGTVVPPADTVRYDSDDPYLVVAADKGTAHLSDTANGISAEYGFWLGDAFASGGSAGYDHKAYGITAKGAWVCTSRHFREIGVDPEKEVITVVGIGDMAGDVFGNGLLLSKTIKLLAAFNHLHIFLDPDPDPASSWVERHRLFNLKRSTWEDYNPGLISVGGGVYSRTAKAVPLSHEVQTMLGVEVDALSGDELMQHILRMEVDLLWNGGIGTYVKASTETHKQAGDSTNDAVRVDAKDLHCRVVGEGGNLGFTQAARVEFARAGGRINTDAVDNSGGVDMSDHEVNLKILAQDLEASGVLDRPGRDALLLEIAEDVATAVEANNHDHGQLLSLDVARSVDELEDFRVLLRDLEVTRKLDRKRHQLPSDGELLGRAKNGEGLLRPELCRTAPFVKMEVYETLLGDERFYGPYVERFLLEYFPEKVRRTLKTYVLRHQLRKEIAATVVTNRLIDAMGATHFSRMQRLTGRSYVEIALASLIAADLLDAWKLKRHLRDLADVRASVEYNLLRQVERTVASLARWLLHRGLDVLDPLALIARFTDGFADYERSLSKILDRSERREHATQVRYMRNRSVLRKLNERAAGLPFVADAGDALMLSERQPGLDVVSAGRLLKSIAVDLHLMTVARLATADDARDGWESRAIERLRGDNEALVLRAADEALAARGEPLPKSGRAVERAVVQAWEEFVGQRREGIARIEAMASRIQDQGARGLAPALVLQATVRELGI